MQGLENLASQSVIYIDDIYLQGDTIELCNQNVIATSNILNKCGFVINPEKSVFIASQEIEYLGFISNSREMTHYHKSKSRENDRPLQRFS